MTEKEAWLLLAEACEKHVASPFRTDGTRCFVIDRETCGGLCSGIYFVGVAVETIASMKHKLVKYGPPTLSTIGGYQWPRTPEGMAQRAEFCRRMAELCRRRWRHDRA